jgi:hypothetical protein
VPRQQSPPCTQGDPFGRHAPGPKSHRDVWLSQTLQHGLPPPEVQFSPLARQAATGSIAHLPSVCEQRSPQHSALVAHASPFCLQRVPPQAPWLQAAEQQSSARVQGAPSATQ